MSNLSLAVIVTTYNWPQALNRVLKSLCNQSYSHYEIIIADDGSTEETKALIDAFKERASISLTHCWQADEGFRAAQIRNLAVSWAKSDYLVFIDGDCVPGFDFVARHAKLAEKGWLVKGNRILLNQRFTSKILQEDIAIEKWGLKDWGLARVTGKINRFMPLIHLPFSLGRKASPRRWQGAKTCNLGIWRQDFIAVNGFDESFIGWGYEDSDLVLRLMRNHVFCKSGKFGLSVMHLWHREASRNQEHENKARLDETLASKHIRAKCGVEQYLK